MIPAVPPVEIADDRHPLGGRRPDRKRHARHAVDHPNMRPQLLVNPVFIALVEQIHVLFAERGQEGIRIVPLPDSTGVELDPQLVAEDLLRPRDEDFEQTLRRQLLHRPARRAAGHDGGMITRVDDRAFRGVVDQGTHDQSAAAAAFFRVHAQQVVGLALLGRQQRFQVGFGGFHRHQRKRTAAQLVQSPVRVEPAYSRLIRFEPFSHADHFVDLEAEVAIELHNRGVRSPHLQIDLRTAGSMLMLNRSRSRQ